ncbi:MAG: PEP-CTERM sorting domain-containing protein [Planctomycetota bacterium]
MRVKTASAALAVLAGVAGFASAQNLLGNGSFETPDASGGDVPGAPAPWLGFNDPNTQFTTQAEAFDGVQSLKTFGPFDFIGGGTGMVQQVPAIAGETYTGEIQALQQSGDALQGGNFGVFKLEFLDASGQFVAGLGQPAGTPLAGFNVFESNAFDASSPLDAWTQLGVGGVAPAGTATVQAVIVQVQLGDGAGGFTGGAIFWDAATVTVPAPASAALLGLGGLAAARRRR